MADFSDKKLGSERLLKLIVGMSIPSIIAQLVNVLYSIVDRIYIGHIPDIGVAALTGVGLTFPITVLVSAFSAFASSSGASLSSICIGKGEIKQAEKILGTCIWFLIVISVALMAVFYIWHEPFLYAFGASDATITYASSYIKIYLAGTIFVEFALGLNAYIILQGHPKVAMMSVLSGAIINIILDPIFIFSLGMGIEGAAIATVISQLVSALWNILYLNRKESVLHMRRKYICFDGPILKKVLALGIAPFAMRFTESLINVVLNAQLQIFGNDMYVGTMTIMQSIQQLILAPINGITQGVQPIVSYNFGAGNFKRTKNTYKIMIAASFLVGFVMTLTVMLCPHFFAGFFTNDNNLIELTGRVIPIFFVGFLFFGIQLGIQPTFLALGQAKISLIIALLRKVILLVPLALILPNFFGVSGVYYAEPAADLISVTIASILFATHIKKILTLESLNKII